MKLTNLNRYQAFASHLLISLVIFAIILLFITFQWYPGILFDAGNGWKAIALIVGVDLVLGPLLTLIIFNPKKSSLKFDLSIIALVQVAALAYGTWTIYQTRPIALAFINTSFVTIFANAEWADEINEKVKKDKTNLYFYVFDGQDNGAALTSDRLEPYSAHAQAVLDLDSPYKEEIPSTSEGTVDQLLIRLDSLTTTRKYIEINKENGAVLGFVKK